MSVIFGSLAVFNYVLDLIKFRPFGYSIQFYFFILASFFLALSLIFNNKQYTKSEEILKERFDEIITKNKHLSFGVYFFLIIILLVTMYFFLPNQIEFLLKNIPVLYKLFLFFKLNIITKTYLGLLIVFSIGSLFFIFVPLEITYLYFLKELNPAISLIVVILSVFVGLSINYLLGLMFSNKIKKNPKFEKIINWSYKYGGLIFILFYFTPFPVQLLTFIFGGIKYPYKKFLLYMIPVIFLKYVALTLFGMKLVEYFSSLIIGLF